MSLSHTTKRAAQALLAALLCVATSFSAAQPVQQAATAPLVRLRMNPVNIDSETGKQPFFLQGTAARHCIPTIAGVTLDGTDLSIELRIPSTGCDSQHQVPYMLQINPQQSMGLQILPGQTYRVRVYAGSGDAPSLVSFQLFDTHAASASFSPENGLWWSEASADTGPGRHGNGASIEWQDGQIAVSLFGFSDTGAATWYFGSARLIGRVARVSLVHLADGDPLFSPTGSQPSAEAGPRMEIEFLSPTRARAWLVRSESGRDVEVRPFTLSRSRFSNGAAGTSWSGQWVLVPDDDGAPRVFEFSAPGKPDAAGFHLEDAGNDARLDCRAATTDTDALPDLCTLSSATHVIADFDQIGLDRLGGRSASGARITLMRVPR
jgi:hypothetical protein